MKDNYYLLSLGCPKNEVDSETMSALLKAEGFHFTSDPQQARFLIVNTCAFIQPAVEEAIEAILDLAQVKADHKDKFLVVAGCLAQRYKGDIVSEIPEVDAILGTGEYGQITDLLKDLAAGRDMSQKCPGRPGDVAYLDVKRRPSAPAGTYAYLKIAEGCSNACAYCAIPRLRGPQISRRPEAILEEARYLVSLGVKELILVAQDSSRYGWDLEGGPSLASLIRSLSREVEGLELIRCLYLYADAISPELIQEMASNPLVAPYIDLPIQHASDRILERMRRHETIDVIRDKIHAIRQAMPQVILRSTVMTGFPGETEADFQALLDFVKEIRFDRLGCFAFWPEEGTLAAAMPDQIPAALAQERRGLIMEAQRPIALEANRKRLGQVTRVLIEGIEPRGILFQGRSYGEAPDIDPLINVAASSPDLGIGSRPSVRILEAGPYELTGVSIDEHSQ